MIPVATPTLALVPAQCLRRYSGTGAGTDAGVGAAPASAQAPVLAPVPIGDHAGGCYPFRPAVLFSFSLWRFSVLFTAVGAFRSVMHH